MSIWRVPVDLNWSGASGSPGVNVFHFRAVDPDTAHGNLNQFIDALHSFYQGIVGSFPSGLTISFAGEAIREAAGGDTPEAATGLHTWTMNGSADNDYLPPANCLILALRTDHYGRAGRGRKFLGPLTRTVSEANGTPSEPERALVASVAHDVLIAPSSAPFNGAWAIYSRKNHQAYDVTGVSVPNEFGVLRSRRD